LRLKPKILNNEVVQDLENDILKIMVVERHGRNSNISVALVKGFGIKKGAMATTVAHDSHNIICVGANDEDIVKSVDRIKKIAGGLVVYDNGVKAELPLQFGGLMSVESKDIVEKQLAKIHEECKNIGCILKSPFMSLSFLALPVIPELKLTDRGLVENFQFVDLFVD